MAASALSGGRRKSSGCEVQRDVAVQRHQVAAEQRAFPPLGQLAAQALRVDRFQVAVDGLQRAVLRQQLHGGLLPDPLDPRHVVRGVAHQGQVVADLLGPHPPLLEDLLPPPLRQGVGFLAGVHHRDPLAHQLQQVLVRREDETGALLVPAAAGQGGDQVVGLEAVAAQAGHAERGQDLLDHRHLGVQVIGGGPPVGLVLLVLLVAEGRGARVQHHGQVLRLLQPEQLEQGAEEAVDRRGVPALRVVQRPADEGEVGAVDQVVPVHQVERRFHASIIMS